jgi:hypothetical protein
MEARITIAHWAHGQIGHVCLADAGVQVDFVARLARSLGVELVKAESLRAMRERPNNPDAVDLSMRGWAMLNSNVDKAVTIDAAKLSERALALDARNVPAMIGLAQALRTRANMNWSEDRAGDIACAEAAIDRVVALDPESSAADSDEAGHAFRKEAGHLFRSEAGRRSDLMSATRRSLPRIAAMMFRRGGSVKSGWI